MADYSLVPVDYQPDFGGYSLVPVDYNPFPGEDDAAAHGGIEVAQAGGASTSPQPPAYPGQPSQPPPVQPQSAQPQPQPVEAESTPPPAASQFDWSHYNQPVGELKPATYTPTQRIGNTVADALMGLGMQPYTASDLTSRMGNVLGMTPLGVAGSALDFIDAKNRGDLPGAFLAAAGFIPGAKGLARGVAQEAGGAIRAAVRGADVQFAQRKVSRLFSSEGTFAGRSIEEIADNLRNGARSPDQLPINVITRDGVTYTLNNRSLMALRLGGQQPTVMYDMTGHPLWEDRLTRRLNEIGSDAGSHFIPQTRRR